MSDKLDELDLKIIRQLQIDPRTSVTELAQKVNLSRPTTTNRLKRLQNEKWIVLRGGLNLHKFGFKVAHVGLEVKTDKTRKEIESYLTKCPRVLDIYRTPEKANIHISVWGEDDQTINSTIESFRDQQNVGVIYTQYLGTPIHGDIIVNVETRKDDFTPCGRRCNECNSYQNSWCKGCPASTDYKAFPQV